MSGDLQLLLGGQALELLFVENALSRMWPLYGPFRNAVPFPEVWQLHCRQGYRNSKDISMVIIKLVLHQAPNFRPCAYQMTLVLSLLGIGVPRSPQ